jgi:hypothetical protein
VSNGVRQSKLTTDNFDGWMTKQEAAAYLGLAEKTLDRIAEGGKVQKGKRKRPGLRSIAVFHPDDLARIKAEREQEQPSIFVLPANGTGHEIQPTTQQQIATALVHVDGDSGAGQRSTR